MMSRCSSSIRKRSAAFFGNPSPSVHCPRSCEASSHPERPLVSSTSNSHRISLQCLSFAKQAQRRVHHACGCLWKLLENVTPKNLAHPTIRTDLDVRLNTNAL